MVSKPILLILLIFGLPLWQSADLETAVSQKLAAYRERYGEWFRYEAAGWDVLGDQALVYLTLLHPGSADAYPGVVDVMPAVQRGNGWEMRLPGEMGYGALLNELAPGLLRHLDTTPYKPAADRDLAPVEPYRFPWVDGQWATVTRSFRSHGPGQLDVDLTGLDVTAAKDGTIIYVNDRSTQNGFADGAWWWWNVVIIEHGPREYSLYGHLLPDSVPERIKSQCSDDISRANCAVPVQAGEVIGQEGNTGVSNNPHLHIEFGQAYGIVPYPDRQGGTIYAGHVYAEQNVAFAGYSADEVARWAFGELHQASHGEALPAGVNLVRNGEFTVDHSEWLPSGQINWAVQNGLLRFMRLRTSDPPDWARFYQDLNYGAPAKTAFEVELLLGNDSGIRKTISVSLLNSAGWEYGLLTCDFVVEAHTPLRPYVMQTVTESTWTNVRLEIAVNPPDSAPAALIDDVLVVYQPEAEITQTVCLD